MRKWVYICLGLGMLLSLQAKAEECASVPGTEQLWSRTQLHWILVGELHGSNETPEIFFDLVCDAVTRGKKVVVALERSTVEQDSLEGILSAEDLPGVKRRLLNLHDWQYGLDGRSSKAMLHLLLSLRTLRQEHPKLAIAAFDAPYTGTAPGARDEALGHALLSIGGQNADSLVLVLVGNAHVMLAPRFGYNPAAMYLPKEQRLSLEVTDLGGQSWSGIGGACGPFEGGVGNKGIIKPRGIFLNSTLAPFGKVDGILSLGVPLTASEPASGIPSPLPSCRVSFLQQQEEQSRRQN